MHQTDAEVGQHFTRLQTCNHRAGGQRCPPAQFFAPRRFLLISASIRAVARCSARPSRALMQALRCLAFHEALCGFGM